MSIPDELMHWLRMVRNEGGEAHTLEGLDGACAILRQRALNGRRIAPMVSERRGRSTSRSKQKPERQQVSPDLSRLQERGDEARKTRLCRAACFRSAKAATADEPPSGG